MAEESKYKEFEERFEELKKKFPLESDYYKIAELASKQTEDPDYSKKKSVVRWQIISTLAIAVVGAIFTITNAIQQQASLKATTATQLMANREKSETDFRQAMFEPLLTQILNDKLDIQQRYATFELFQNNFNDLFNSSSLYYELWSKSNNKKDSVVRKNLIDLVKYTNAQQEQLIYRTGRRRTFYLSCTNDSIDYRFYDDDNDIKVGEHILIHLNDHSGCNLLSEDSISTEVTMSIICTKKIKKWMIYDVYKSDTIQVNYGKPFHLSYFNTPLSDNFIMPDGDRIGVILKEFRLVNNIADTAVVDIIHFPADYVTIGYRPSLERVHSMINN